MPTPSADQQRRARVFGAWFALTFVFSIPALILYDPVLNDTGYVLGEGSVTRVELGALFEGMSALSGIATAVVIWPIVKRQSETLALSYVAIRTFESVMVVTGAMSLLTVVTLREDLAGSVASESLNIAGQSLVAFHDWTFLFGPAFCAGIGNGLILGYLMYRSGLMPPRLALIGVIGGPVSVIGATFVLFGAWDQTDSIQFLFTLPEIVWELSIAVFMLWKGFRPARILDDSAYATGTAA
jgi:hypothetical protein